MATVRVVYNKCYGGFSLSKEGLDLYNQKLINSYLPTISNRRPKNRHDPLLIEVIEELGDKANGKCSKLFIKEIPAEYIDCYSINEYDGKEYVECDPSNLVSHKYSSLDVDTLTDAECRDRLKDIVTILNSQR